MAWKKGAVVIIKRGDEEWGDAIENALNIQTASRKEVEELENENKSLKQSNDLSKIHDTRFTNNMIENLKIDCSDIKPLPKWAGFIYGIYGLFVYLISKFADKYLRY